MQSLQLNISNFDGLAGLLFNDLKPLLEDYIKNFNTLLSVNKEFITVDETIELLDMTAPTLNKLCKAGLLKKHSIPGSRRVFYKKSEIMKLLNESVVE